LVSAEAAKAVVGKRPAKKARVLAEESLAEVFGIELGGEADRAAEAAETGEAAKPAKKRRRAAAKPKLALAGKQNGSPKIAKTRAKAARNEATKRSRRGV